jgi:hypothetical protein
MTTTTLLNKKWLLREWHVATSSGDFVVTYSGRGHGYESVRVNGAVAVKTRSSVWFTPKFDFLVGASPASVEVRVWPWLAVRAIRLRVADDICYSEGFK